MSDFQWGLLVGVFCAGIIAVGFFVQRRRRQRRHLLFNQPFTDQQTQWVTKNWVQWPQLPNELRQRVEGLSQVMLDLTAFEACGGLREVTDEMRFTIAAQAALLWANQEGSRPYPDLKAILVYPDAYKVTDELGVESVRLGESWSRGSVVVAWESVREGGQNDQDGHNLVFHEFAHQLDTVNGAADGFPELPRDVERAKWEDWPKVFSREYEVLCRETDRGRKTVLDPYGSTNEAEFFAVAVETFFEKPEKLHEEHLQLFELLVKFFAMDPRGWSADGR